MTTSKQLQLIERYVAAYNRFDVEGMLEGLGPDVVFKNIANGEVTTETHGVEAFRELAEKSKVLFAQRRQQIVSHRFDEDCIYVDIDFSGTLAIDIPQGPSAGETLAVAGRSEFAFDDNKIVAITDIS